jgi:hypothetical protein
LALFLLRHPVRLLVYGFDEVAYPAMLLAALSDLWRERSLLERVDFGVDDPPVACREHRLDVINV